MWLRDVAPREEKPIHPPRPIMCCVPKRAMRAYRRCTKGSLEKVRGAERTSVVRFASEKIAISFQRGPPWKKASQRGAE